MTEDFIPVKEDVLKAFIHAYQQIVKHGRGAVSVRFENAGSKQERYSINVEYEIAFIRPRSERMTE